MLVGKTIIITQHFNSTTQTNTYQHRIDEANVVNWGYDKDKEQAYLTYEIFYDENGYDQVFVYEDDTMEVFQPPHYNHTLTAELV